MEKEEFMDSLNSNVITVLVLAYFINNMFGHS
jgi:hypothetical protein